MLREYLLEKGHQDILGSRDATRMAFKLGLIDDGDSWMDMIRDRNRTSHSYNQDTAQAIAANIKQRFLGLFVQLQIKLRNLPDDSD
ncbi:HI0074 family nucleotidyltransferase substrate-binding subunit [Methylomonas koyamae]|uniref:HI0074 family nucleotidyltransferase substrate-binding subunit n=1 Tax=Methylomonas koyamae TaxID=702114 RepID=UPI0021102695|nr:HI0074 family nucleotidyltransferase substrate-binding subunit [Methylomonas koyamae]